MVNISILTSLMTETMSHKGHWFTSSETDDESWPVHFNESFVKSLLAHFCQAVDA